MSSAPEQQDDPTDAEVVGVPPDTKAEVEPSATGLVVGPLYEPRATDVEDRRVDPEPDADPDAT